MLKRIETFRKELKEGGLGVGWVALTCGVWIGVNIIPSLEEIIVAGGLAVDTFFRFNGFWGVLVVAVIIAGILIQRHLWRREKRSGELKPLWHPDGWPVIAGIVGMISVFTLLIANHFVDFGSAYMHELKGETFVGFLAYLVIFTIGALLLMGMYVSALIHAPILAVTVSVVVMIGNWHLTQAINIATVYTNFLSMISLTDSSPLKVLAFISFLISFFASLIRFFSSSLDPIEITESL